MTDNLCQTIYVQKVIMDNLCPESHDRQSMPWKSWWTIYVQKVMMANLCPENDNGQSMTDYLCQTIYVLKSWRTNYVQKVMTANLCPVMTNNLCEEYHNRQSMSRKSWWTMYILEVMMDNVCPERRNRQCFGFGLISVLQPFNTFYVISGMVSYPNHTVPGKQPRQFTST